MQNERDNLSERFLNFAANIIKLVVRLNKTAVGCYNRSKPVYPFARN